MTWTSLLQPFSSTSSKKKVSPELKLMYPCQLFNRSPCISVSTFFVYLSFDLLMFRLLFQSNNLWRNQVKADFISLRQNQFHTFCAHLSNNRVFLPVSLFGKNLQSLTVSENPVVLKNDKEHYLFKLPVDGLLLSFDLPEMAVKQKIYIETTSISIFLRTNSLYRIFISALHF